MVPGEEKGKIPISIVFSIEGNKNIFPDTHYSTKLLSPQPQASGSITHKTQGEKAGQGGHARHSRGLNGKTAILVQSIDHGCVEWFVIANHSWRS